MHALTTLLDWIRYSASRLAAADVYYGHGTDNALDEAAALVLGLLKLPYDLSPAYFSARLTADEIAALQHALERRISERVPVPYLTRRTLYGGYEFYIDERAPIPRATSRRGGQKTTHRSASSTSAAAAVASASSRNCNSRRRKSSSPT